MNVFRLDEDGVIARRVTEDSYDVIRADGTRWGSIAPDFSPAPCGSSLDGRWALRTTAGQLRGWDRNIENLLRMTGITLEKVRQPEEGVMAEEFPRGSNGERYFLKGDFPGADWTEVTKSDWIRAERAAGSQPKMASTDPRYMDTCATGGFSSSGRMSGTVTYDGGMPKY